MLFTLKKFIKYLTGDNFIYIYAHTTYINSFIYIYTHTHMSIFIHMYEISKYPPKSGLHTKNKN